MKYIFMQSTLCSAFLIGLVATLPGCSKLEDPNGNGETPHDYSSGYNPDGSVALNIGPDGKEKWPAGWPNFAPLDSKGRPPWHPEKHVYAKCPNPFACEDHKESAPHGGKPHWEWPHTKNKDGSRTYHCTSPSMREIYRVDVQNGFENADPRSNYDPERDGPPPQIDMNTFLPRK